MLFAGMPMIGLSDLARARVQTLSFFALLLLVLAFLAQRLWNWLRKDFPRLPELGFRRALALVVLWGLAFHLVLTMISGARELLTPGAWEKRGTTYRVKAAPPEEQASLARQERLLALRGAIFRWADANGGKLPPHDFVAGIPEELWRALDPSGVRLVYFAGQKRGERTPLVVEPEMFGQDRYALYADGSIGSVQR